MENIFEIQTAAGVQPIEDRVGRELTAQLSADIALLKTNYTGIRWNIADDEKVIEYIGSNALKTKLMNWIDNSAKPCEVKKDGTDFAYLVNTEGIASSTNWLRRVSGASSHYNTSDKADYLQMVELENINVAELIDEDTGTHSILFNFDELTPTGFHRWFHEHTKLMSRYDLTFHGQDANATTVDCCKGNSQPSGNFSFNNIQTLVAATGAKILKWTAWEIAVLAWLQAYRFGTFDVPNTERGRGLQDGGEAAARGWVSGTTDSLTTPHGGVNQDGNGGYRFMYMENPTDGKQWLMGFGWRGMNGRAYFTYDDFKANAAALMPIEDADDDHTYPTDLSASYAKEVNLLGIAKDKNGSSTTGFYNGNWSNTENDRIFYAGGTTNIGVLCGAFARDVNYDVSFACWDQRGRCAMRKSSVVAAS